MENKVVQWLIVHIYLRLLWVLLYVFAAVFLAYRQLIDIMLRLKLGKKYGGLVNTADSMYVIKDVGRPVIAGVLILKSESEIDFYNTMLEKFKRKVFDSPDDYLKLTSTLRSLGGYSFYIRNDYKIEDCVKLFPVPKDVDFDENYLKEVTGILYNAPFGKNDTGLWEMIFFNRTLNTKKQDGFVYYPLILRLDHMIGDGTSIVEYVIHVLGDEMSLNYSKKIFSNASQDVSKDIRTKLSFGNILFYLIKLFNFLALVFDIVFIGLEKGLHKTQQENSSNVLSGVKNTGKKICAWYTENEIEYIPIVKKIKNRVPNTKFSNVFMTAVSASLTNFFKKNSQSIPEAISVLSPILLQFRETDTSKPVRLENKSVHTIQRLPLNVTGSLVETLEAVKLMANEVKYRDVLIHSFMGSKLLGLFPQSIRTHILAWNSYSCLVSNVPGSSQISLLDGCVVDKMISCVPTIKTVRIAICNVSYDDRLQVAVVVDKAVISTQEEADQIVDDIFINIKLLDTAFYSQIHLAFPTLRKHFRIIKLIPLLNLATADI